MRKVTKQIVQRLSTPEHGPQVNEQPTNPHPQAQATQTFVYNTAALAHLNMACRSLAGFQLVSMSTTRFAATRLMPMFPALVDSKNTPVDLRSGSLNLEISCCLRRCPQGSRPREREAKTQRLCGYVKQERRGHKGRHASKTRGEQSTT